MSTALSSWEWWPLMVTAVLTSGAWLSFVRSHKHVLSLLLLMEVALVGLLVGFSSFSGELSWLCWALIVVGVCESAMGMALLVRYVRSHGSDRTVVR